MRPAGFEPAAYGFGGHGLLTLSRVFSTGGKGSRRGFAPHCDIATRYDQAHDSVAPTRSSWSMTDRDALIILEEALARCEAEDVRTPELYAALDHLAVSATAAWPFAQCRHAIEDTIDVPGSANARWQLMNAAINGIRRVCRRPRSECRRCLASRFVCEAHTGLPWPHGECPAGIPCPACNVRSRPELPPDFQSLARVEEE